VYPLLRRCRWIRVAWVFPPVTDLQPSRARLTENDTAHFGAAATDIDGLVSIE